MFKIDNKEKILELYYSKHLKQVEIAKLLGVSKQNVSATVRKDSRFISEKESRKKANAESRKIYMKNYFKTYKRPKQDDTILEELKILQKQNSIEMSYKNTLSDSALAKWVSSAYHINKNGNLTLDSKFRDSKDLPKIILRNAKLNPQNFKKKYVFNA